MKKYRARKIEERFFHSLFFINGILVIVVLAGIFAILLKTAAPAFREIDLREFFFTVHWDPAGYEKESYGIIAMLVSTFLVTLGALAIAIPIGIGAAAYLCDVAGPRVREIAKPLIEVLAAIPSVVLGFIGIVVVNPMLAKFFRQPNGLNAVNGSILLAIMALPTIISITEDALVSVPRSFEQASLALGATKWQTIIRVKIPAALSGIIAACMLGMGRAIGETMTVLMATGCAPALPTSYLHAVRTMTATIAIELGEVPYYSTHYYGLFAIGLTLFIITFMINLVADLVLHNFQKMQR
ncbi:MAG: phosphate ABC transporter permease subunit PstC [Candidatus Omnitrophica bacterium]|nr:phosphate ABC transporter permease subunit PstC [Candidatus Omnitrophota bacterium]